MNDLILTSRLDSLEQNLTQIVDNSEWLRDLVLTRYELGQEGVCKVFWPDQTWDLLDSTVGNEAKGLKAELEKIRTILSRAVDKNPEEAAQDIKKAWDDYKKVYEYSKVVFDECLEYIAGLALRDRGFDRKICDIADHLIISCSNDWNDLNWHSLTVLAAQERLGQTLARIIRLRFPEWSIWTLPFTAREFAHVALHDQKNQRLLAFVNQKVDELVKKEPRLVEARNAKAPEDSLEVLERQARKYAQNHIHELIADAFATYTMGPAYACAALLLRFNPIDGGSDVSEHATDAKRAEVVLGMLKEMNKKAKGLPPYDDIIKRLENEWNAARARSTPSLSYPATRSTPRLEEVIDVNALITETWVVFKNGAREAALFPSNDEKHGWLKAQAWHSTLMDNLKNEPDINRFAINKNSRLRDALNAAWLCRIYVQPKDNLGIKRISKAALNLCVSIMKAGARQDGSVSSSLGNVAAPPAQDSFNKAS